VGSVVYDPDNSRDVDLVLTPKNAMQMPIRKIERALVSCVEIGIDSVGLCVDPIYRKKLIEGPLASQTMLQGFKLEDPALTYRQEARLVSHIKPIGKILVEISQKSSSCSFFEKLPGTSNVREVPWIALKDLVPWSISGGKDWPVAYC
jgi:hypothetical protein